MVVLVIIRRAARARGVLLLVSVPSTDSTSELGAMEETTNH